jgi:hypothetical protein
MCYGCYLCITINSMIMVKLELLFGGRGGIKAVVRMVSFHSLHAPPTFKHLKTVFHHMPFVFFMLWGNYAGNWFERLYGSCLHFEQLSHIFLWKSHASWILLLILKPVNNVLQDCTALTWIGRQFLFTPIHLSGLMQVGAMLLPVSSLVVLL